MPIVVPQPVVVETFRVITQASRDTAVLLVVVIIINEADRKGVSK